MKDIQQFLSTMMGKIIAIVLVLGIGLFIGSRGATHKNEPVAETPTQVVVADSISTAPVAQAKTAPEPKPVVVQKKSVPVAPTPTPVTQPDLTPTPVAPTPVPSNQSMRIDSLASIRMSGGLQENWDADLAKDGPTFDIVYLDKDGNIITSDATEKMPISADVKLYAGNNALAEPNRLVYSGHFDTNQIILGSIYPKIRVPEEQMTVNSGTDYKYGTATVTIHTPNQGDFSASSDFVVLY